MRFLPVAVLAFCLPALAQTAERPQALATFVGHWEGGGTFQNTPFSEEGSITSKTDCAWSPQGHYLVCEQTLTDPKGTHQQLTVYTADAESGGYTYYTMTEAQKPFTGQVKIEGNTWTYDNSFEKDGKKTEIRTVNIFNGDEESFKTEYSEDGGAWSTMLQGKSHRVKK